jgi:pimeloyl-ACP methyl ester carboxylesterase
MSGGVGGAKPRGFPLSRFLALVARRIVAGSGHFMPREKPDAVSTALLEVLAASR